MLYFLGALVVTYLVWRHVTKRGKHFVKAVNFLECLDSGATIEEANEMSNQLFTNQLPADMENHIIQSAMRVKELHFNGKQMTAINLAISKGFRGN